jgi:LPS-assembly protein
MTYAAHIGASRGLSARSRWRRSMLLPVLLACLAAPAAGQQGSPAPPSTSPTPAPAPASATPATVAGTGTAETPPTSPALPPAQPLTTSEPPAANTGDVPASAPAVNPASPPGTAAGAPAAGAIGPSPAGTVPSSQPAATPGGGARVNPATGAPAAPGGARKGPPGAGLNRMDFSLKFEDGAVATGSAVNFDYRREDYAVLTGAVQVRYQDMDLSGDHVEINLKTKEVVAQGNVILDQGPKRMTGTTLNFDLDTKTGKMLEATAYVAPDFFFSGVEIDKTGDDTYTVLDGFFTACTQTNPDWSFHMGRAEVVVEGYAHMHHVTFDVKDLPIFYTPWMLYPAKKDRAAGLLVPTIKSSGNRGSSLDLAYFQPIGDSFDDTFHLEPYIRGYLGIGDEFRYRPSEGTWGDIVAYAVKDPTDEGKERWKISANHDTEDLPFGMRLVLQYQKYSDFDYLRDFERDFDISSLRFVTSRAFITGAWGPNLLNILLNDNQILFNNGTDFVSDTDQKKLPEIEYQLRSTKLGPTPFYLEMDNYVDYLQVNQPGGYSGSYGRVDLFPQVTLPVNTFSWLNLSVTGGERLTWYEKSLNATDVTTTVFTPAGATTTTEVTGATAVNGPELHRILPYGSAEIVGPSFSKILEKEIFDFAKFKHVIEPRITYTYYGLYNEERQSLLPQFDQIDGPLSTNNVRVALDNRLLAKGDDEDSSAREIMLFEVSRMYSFDPTLPFDQSVDGADKHSAASPFDALLRINPSDLTSLQGEITYSTLFRRLESTSLSANITLPKNQLIGLTWYVNFIPDTGATESDQVRLNTAVNIIPERLSVQAQVGWDIVNHLLGEQYYAINWAEQCFGLRLELREFKALTGPRLNDTDIRFSITLKGIGSVLDLNSRSTQTAP